MVFQVKERLKNFVNKTTSTLKKYPKSPAFAGALGLNMALATLGFGQEKKASGNVTFNSARNAPIEAKATDLFDGGHEYDISGNTNEAISFTDYLLKSDGPITGLKEKFVVESDKQLIINNPSKQMEAFFTNTYNQVYMTDLQGKIVANPKILQHSDNISQIYFDARNLADGMYIVKYGPHAFKFQVKDNPFANNFGPTNLDNVIDKLGKYVLVETNDSNPSNGRTAAVNYNLAWSKGFGLLAGQKDIEFIEGDDNDVEVEVESLPDARFVIDGAVTNADNGRAVLTINGTPIDSLDFQDGTFTFYEPANYDKENNLDDKQASVLIKSLTQVYENKRVDLNLTSDIAGDNPYNFETEVTWKNIEKFANLHLKLHDTRLNKTVENIRVNYNNQNYYLDSVFTLKDIPVGQSVSLYAAKTDSSYNFTQLPITITDLVEGDNERSFNVTTEPFNHEALYVLEVTDENGRTTRNSRAIVNGEEFILDESGTISKVISLPEGEPRFWEPGSKDVNVRIEPTDSSYQFNPKTNIISISTNYNDAMQIATNPFQWYANLAVDFIDFDDPLQGVLLQSEGKSSTSNASGRARIDQVVELLEKSAQEFWLPGTKSITYTASKDGFNTINRTKIVSQGDNIYQENMSGVQEYANLTIKLHDTRLNKTVENPLFVYDGQTQGTDSIFTIENIPVGDAISISALQSDSSYVFNQIDEIITGLVAGDNERSFNVTTQAFNHQAVYMLDVTDDNGRTVRNSRAIVNGEEFILDDSGSITKAISLPEGEPRFWEPGEADLDVIVEQTATSYQFTRKTKTGKIINNTNDNISIQTVPFDWQADVIYETDDGTNPLNDVTVNSEGQSGQTVDGKVRFNDIVTIPAKSAQEFWLPGTVTISYTANKDGFTEASGTTQVTDGVKTVPISLEEIVVGDKFGAFSADIRGYGSLIDKAVVETWQLDDQGVSFSGITNQGDLFFGSLPLINNQTTDYVVKVTFTSETNAAGSPVEFYDTYDTLAIKDGFNLTDPIFVEEVLNEQDLTVNVFHYKNLNSLNGQTVYLYDASNDNLLATKVSAGGKVVFDNIPGGSNIYLAVDAAGYYKKTNGIWSIPTVDKIAETSDEINIMSVEKLKFGDNSPFTAERLNDYIPQEYLTSFLWGEQGLHIPQADGGNQPYIDRFSYIAQLMGFEGAYIFSPSPFADPTSAEGQAYGAYPWNKNLLVGNIGVNVTSLAGTETYLEGKNLPNGNKVTFYSVIYKLEGTNWAGTDHEHNRALGYSDREGYPTCGSITNPVPIDQSPSDLIGMPHGLYMGKAHFVLLAPNGKTYEYNTPRNYEEGM